MPAAGKFILLYFSW